VNLSIGSLCTGFGGLDKGVQAVLGGRLAWVADPEPGPDAILAHHHPDVPNLGDIWKTDWATVEPVDILTAGFSCQDISDAGLRAGISGSRSRIWKAVAQAVRGLRPGLVVLENVAAIRSKGRGLDVVIADLAEIGYDARWTCVRAGDPETGAPHQRNRWIAAAYPAAEDPDLTAWRERGASTAREAESRRARADAGGRGGVPVPAALRLLPSPAARDWRSGASNLLGVNARPLNEVAVNLLPMPDQNWIALDGTDYGPAIRRWENILGHPAPCPTEPGTRGNRRLNPAFAEWMMGVPGLVTGTPGLDRKQQLTAIGNGAMPQQMATALRFLLQLDRTAVAQ
jgi:DNA (cytosine-5)-methyltransferase 1